MTLFEEDDGHFNFDHPLLDTNYLGAKHSNEMMKDTTTNNKNLLKSRANMPMSSRIRTKKQKFFMMKKRRQLAMKRREKEGHEGKTHRCQHPECEKFFMDKNSYRKHLITHGEKQFICQAEGCGKRFLDNSKLKRHMLVHSGEKPYKCELCNKRFSLDFNLRTHLRIHTGEKPYVCSFEDCYKRFSQSSNLSAHEKTHFLPKFEEQKAEGYTRGKKIIFKVTHANQVAEKPKLMIILDRQKYMDKIKTAEKKESGNTMQQSTVLDSTAEHLINATLKNSKILEKGSIGTEQTNVTIPLIKKEEENNIAMEFLKCAIPMEELEKEKRELEDEFKVPFFLTREYALKHIIK